MNGVSNLQSAAEEFADDLLYLRRTATTTGSGGTVKTADGVDPQSGDIHVNTLARRAIMQSENRLAVSATSIMLQLLHNIYLVMEM